MKEEELLHCSPSPSRGLKTEADDPPKFGVYIYLGSKKGKDRKREGERDWGMCMYVS